MQKIRKKILIDSWEKCWTNGRTDSQTDIIGDIIEPSVGRGPKKKDKQKFRWKCEMFPYYLREIVQNEPKANKNVQDRGRPSTFLSLVTATVILRYSWKKSRECFTFLNTLRNIPKIGPKILQSSHQQRDKSCEIFLSTLTVRVIQKCSA